MQMNQTTPVDAKSVQLPDNRQQEQEIDLLELIYRLLEKWKVILLLAVVCAFAAGVYVYNFVTPLYKATSKLYIVNSKDSAINLSDLQIGNYLAKDYTEVFDNWHVHEMVLEKLGLDYTYKQIGSMISVRNPDSTRILYITATSPDPNEAKLLADTYADVAKEFIAETMGTEEPNLFQEALLPTVPSSPNKTRTILLGFILGFAFGCAVVVVRFMLDDRVHTGDEITKYVNLPMLGSMPRQKGKMVRSAIEGGKGD